MADKRRLSRIAGLLYLVVVATGMFSLAYVPKRLFEWNDASKTFENIMAHETLFRLSIASSAVCYLAFIFLPIALHELLKHTDAFIAKLMALLAIISVPISLLNLQNKYAVLSLVGSTQKTDTQAMRQASDQAMAYLSQYDNGILIATVFWGLWLLPFGYLVYKSRFLPKALGILLMLGCLGYLMNFFGNTVSNAYGAFGISQYLGLLPAIGEIGTCLWLLTVGPKPAE